MTGEGAEREGRLMVEPYCPRPERLVPEDLREKAGRYEGKKAPSYLQYVDTTLVDEAKKQLGWK